MWDCTIGWKESNGKQLLAVGVICPLSRRARAKLGGMRLRSLCFQTKARTHVLAHASSTSDLEGKCTGCLPSISTEGWMDEKAYLDE